ncbi:MAG: DUF3179 domain-containing (seleno)protein [Thermoanaerobaculia bacterium]
METHLILASSAVLVAAVAVFPGSLGVVMFTHKLLARPAGAFLFNVLAPFLWLASLALLLASGWAAVRTQSPIGSVVVAGILVAGTTLFGFLMHMRFMFKPVREPRYLTPDEALERFGSDEEVVGVIDSRERPFAYIARLARRPHVVYQAEGEAPFIMTHCILSHSSMAYELDEQFSASRIYVSSVLANNLVFYDKTNNCTVLQIKDRARDGRYELTTLPTLHCSLASWRRFYPESEVWYRPREWRDTFYLKLLARASVIDQASPDLVYPLERDPDERLPLKAYVLGVNLGGECKAFPIEVFADTPAVEDTVGGEPIVFLASEGGDLIHLFSSRLESGRVLHWQSTGPERFEDLETRSTWTCTGTCVAGELEGRRLESVPHYNKIFWCVWADYFPATTVYSAAEQTRPPREP